MENEKMIRESSGEDGNEVMNSGEFIPDYSFLYKIRQLTLRLDIDHENYGFCLES